MKRIKKWVICLTMLCLSIFFVISFTQASEEYRPDWKKWKEAKKLMDDPRPFLKTYGMKQVVPPEAYAKMTFDVEEMKKTWAEVVGFKSPDLVGKIAPEIKPGIYNYKDKDKHPGLKELMIPAHYELFRAGGPPVAPAYPEIEVVPTQQVWYSLPIAKATQLNSGKTKQDDQGYMIPGTYVSGFPFPKPSGNLKAQQIVFNWQERYFMGEQYFALEKGYDFRGTKIKFYGEYDFFVMKPRGRVMFKPLGDLDERARQRNETKLAVYNFYAPRDQYGNVISIINKGNLDDNNQMIMWLAQIRRLRKISGTDAQDAAADSNTIFDDFEGFNQKLSPKIFPYKYELIAEREYLVPSFQQDGSVYLTKEGLEARNIKYERRPIYVVQMMQQDPSYVYQKRVLYIDKETFVLYRIENFDRKMKLWRSAEYFPGFEPNAGYIWGYIYRDCTHTENQTGFYDLLAVPVDWLTREHFGLKELERRGK